MQVTTRDEHDLNIILNAEYWTAIVYSSSLGRCRLEFKTFHNAATGVNIIKPDKALIYAVKHPNDAAVASYVNGKWSLHAFKDKKLVHPLAKHFISGICKN
jgi:hypothetical protein